MGQTHFKGQTVGDRKGVGMKPEASNPVLSEKLRKIQENRTVQIPPEDIRKVAEEVVNSLRGDISLSHIQLYEELSEMAQFIKKARMEIAAVRPNDIPSMHIPSATDELEAVVGATEVATGTILDSCEVISAVINQLPHDFNGGGAVGGDSDFRSL